MWPFCDIEFVCSNFMLCQRGRKGKKVLRTSKEVWYEVA